MITFVSPIKSRQADFAMPISRCDDASWLRALPEITGEVSVLGTAAKGGVRLVAADVHNLPGNPAWSPPT